MHHASAQKYGRQNFWFLLFNTLTRFECCFLRDTFLIILEMRLKSLSYLIFKIWVTAWFFCLSTSIHLCLSTKNTTSFQVNSMSHICTTRFCCVQLSRHIFNLSILPCHIVKLVKLKTAKNRKFCFFVHNSSIEILLIVETRMCIKLLSDFIFYIIAVY